MAAINACSISAPEKPSATLASCSRSKRVISRLRFKRWILKISLRSSAVGRSTKKISSKRPFLKNSPGKRSTRLAVAITNTGEVFSCIQVRKEPKIRLDVPPSESEEPVLPANDLSSSSINRITGEIDSAVFKALRRFASERLFYSAQPLAVTSSNCLKCHSTPEVAPKSHVERYGTENGYGWELNQVIGAQVIYVPASEVTSNARQALFLFINIFIGIFALVIVAINYLLKKRVIQPLKPMAQLAQTISKDTVSATEIRVLEDSLTDTYQRTDELGQLARVFQKMVREIYMRERQLAEQLKQLQVEVDQTQVRHQVSEIEESDYFQNLKKSAKEIRKQSRE